MPSRKIVAGELAEIFKIIAHPDRIRIIEELGDGELDVSSMAEALDLNPSRVSQHLALMRAHRLVEERRDGRHHFYHLSNPDMAGWIIEAIGFVELRESGLTRSTIREAKALWNTTDN